MGLSAPRTAPVCSFQHMTLIRQPKQLTLSCFFSVFWNLGPAKASPHPTRKPSQDHLNTLLLLILILPLLFLSVLGYILQNTSFTESRQGERPDTPEKCQAGKMWEHSVFLASANERVRNSPPFSRRGVDVNAQGCVGFSSHARQDLAHIQSWRIRPFAPPLLFKIPQLTRRRLARPVSLIRLILRRKRDSVRFSLGFDQVFPSEEFYNDSYQGAAESETESTAAGWGGQLAFSFDFHFTLVLYVKLCGITCSAACSSFRVWGLLRGQLLWPHPLSEMCKNPVAARLPLSSSISFLCRWWGCGSSEKGLIQVGGCT